MGEMAAQLAHQVRTPLSTAVLYAGQLARGDLGDAQRRQFSEKLREGLRHTENLVREMLAFSRGGNFSNQPIRLGDALHTAIAGLQPRLRQLDARLDLALEDGDDSLLAGNLDALAGAFSNLIDNALDHGGRGVRIRISACHATDAILYLRVDDDGPGIEPLALTRIFDPFFTTRERGTGLGLAVVQAVVLEHGGSLRVGESALGGACFEIQLPRLESGRLEQITTRKQA
jgi:two-component system sensor histidine kinase FlrB